MKQRSMLLAASALALASLPFDASAQTVKSVAGTYAPVSVPAFGDKPTGQMILTADGHYSIVLTRNNLTKIAAGARPKGTPEENKAVVDGSIGHVGRYSIDEGGKFITFKVATSTFANWNGTTQKRKLTVKGDTLTYRVEAPSTGGAPNDVTWRKVK